MNTDTLDDCFRVNLVTLCNRTYFKIAFLAVLGVYIALTALLLPLILFNLVHLPYIDDIPTYGTVLIVVVAMVIAPIIWAGALTLGHMLSKAMYQSIAEVTVQFTGTAVPQFEAIDANSLYQLLLSGFRGVVTICAAFYILITGVSLLAVMFAGSWGEVSIILGAAFLFILALTIMPYVLAWMMGMGGYISKPIVRRLGWGELNI